MDPPETLLKPYIVEICKEVVVAASNDELGGGLADEAPMDQDEPEAMTDTQKAKQVILAIRGDKPKNGLSPPEGVGQNRESEQKKAADST